MAKKEKAQLGFTKVKSGTKINELSPEMQAQVQKVQEEAARRGSALDHLGALGDQVKKVSEEAELRGHIFDRMNDQTCDDLPSLAEAACAVDDFVHQQGKAAMKPDPLVADPKAECDLEPADVERVVNEYMYALQQLCNLGGDYMQVLETAVSVWDKRISDELHHLEMRDMPEEELVRSARVIALCRRKRRGVKNMLSALQALKGAGAFSISHNVNASAVAESVDKLDYKEYKLRDPEYFYGVRGMNHRDYSIVIPYNMGEQDPETLYPKWEGVVLNG